MAKKTTMMTSPRVSSLALVWIYIATYTLGAMKSHNTKTSPFLSMVVAAEQEEGQDKYYDDEEEEDDNEGAFDDDGYDGEEDDEDEEEEDSDDSSITADDNNNDDSSFVCGVYLAESTLPGTGIGMYAGPKGYRKGETITKELGDLIVPITDLKTTHSDTGLYDEDAKDMTKYFLWDQYTWSPGAFGIGIENIAYHQTEIASAGFGAAANSFMDFVNVEEGNVEFGLLEGYTLHRSKDPGAGAFSPYHSRRASAKTNIPPNSEFFVSYGNNWFLDRAWRLGTIPVEGDHAEAEQLWKSFHRNFLGGRRRKKRNDSENENDDDDDGDDEATSSSEQRLQDSYREFWDDVVTPLSKDVWQDSRVFAALPTNKDDYSEMLTTEGGYIEVKKKRMGRSQEWLEEHGVCADAVRIGRSTLQQAGHGAFAKKKFAQGEVVLAAPLIHIPDKAILDTYFMYNQQQDEDDEDDDVPEGPYKARIHRQLLQHRLKVGFEKTGKQLLLNYVFGHANSTMLLSPYGPGVQLINHNQTQANVRLQWASTTRSMHNPDLLNESVDHICANYPLGSALAMEIVALKEILPDDELFLDYGDAWERAWNEHVQNWKPTFDSDTYVAATDLNKGKDPLPEFNASQVENNPFPPTVRLMLSKAWKDDEFRIEHGDSAITDEVMWADYDYDFVELLVPSVGSIIQQQQKETTPKQQERRLKELESKRDLYQEDPLFANLNEHQKENVRKQYFEKESNKTSTANNSNTPLEKFDQTLYTVVVLEPIDDDEEDDPDELGDENNEDGENPIDETYPRYRRRTIENVPRRGLKFEDLSYTHDQFLQNAFRHEIHIPDDIFPQAWKNVDDHVEENPKPMDNGNDIEDNVSSSQDDDADGDGDDDDDTLPQV